jgi:hypothetical protein
MYLFDTNIFLEGLLDQHKAPEVRAFLQKIPLEQILISDLSLHSIGIILYGLGKHALFLTFVLDFDDAYQYTVATDYNLQLMSSDQDFNRTEINKSEPAEILESL